MAKPTKQILLATTVVATGEIVKARFITATGKQAKADEPILGIAAYDAKANDTVAVEVLGIGMVESGGAIAIGDKVASDAQGCAVKSDAGQFVALSATDSANVAIKVLLR